MGERGHRKIRLPMRSESLLWSEQEDRVPALGGRAWERVALPGHSSGGNEEGLDPRCIFRKYIFKGLLTVQKQGIRERGKSRMARKLGA